MTVIDANERLCINKWKILHDNGYFSTHNHYTGFCLNADDIARHIIEECGITKDTEALEIGCGYGRIMYALADHVKSIIGVDLHEGPLKKAKEVLKDKPYAFAYLCDGQSIPLNDQCIDFIYSMSAMQHMPRSVVKKYVDECVRVLKPSGMAYLHFLDKTYGGKNDISPNVNGEQSVGWAKDELEALAGAFNRWEVTGSGKSLYVKGWM